MKQLIFFICCLFFLGANAQTTKTYSYAKFFKSNKQTDWIELEKPAKIIYNYSKITLIFAGETDNFTSFGAIKVLESKNGIKCRQYTLINDKTGEEMILNVFLEEKYGVMFVDIKNDVLQLINVESEN